MLELLIDQPIFIGFKVDRGLRQHLESLSDSNRQYVSADDSEFLRLCRVGEDIYVGKLIHECLTTNQVDDIRRNVLSIIRKLGHTVRLPSNLRVLACSGVEADHLQGAVQLSSPQQAQPPRAAVR